MPVTSSRQKSAQDLAQNHSMESYGERMEEKGGRGWSRPASLSFLVSGEGSP